MKVWFNLLCLFWFVLSASTSCGFLSCSLTKFLSFPAGLWSVFGALFVRKEIIVNTWTQIVIADHNPPIASFPVWWLILLILTHLTYHKAWTANLLPSKFWGKCSIRQAVLEPHMNLKFVTVCTRSLGVSTAALFRRDVYAVCNVHNERNLTIQKA